MVEGRRAEMWQHTAWLAYVTAISNSAKPAKVDPRQYNPYQLTKDALKSTANLAGGLTMRQLHTHLSGQEFQDG